MAFKLLALILTLFLLVGCQPDTAGEVSSADATAPEAFDNPPVTSDIFPANIVEDSASNWIFLPYSDPDGDVATSCQISNRSYVNVSTACVCSFGICRVKVTPFQNRTGQVSFSFSVTAKNQTSQISSAVFNVVAVAEAPAAVETSFSVPENTTYTSNGIIKPHLQGVDPDGDTLTCIKETDTTQGILNVNSDCSFDYTPTPGYEGADSFSFKVDDGFFVSAPVTVSINVTKVNVVPVTSGSLYSTYQNVAIPVTLSAVDADADPLIYYIITAPAFGTLTGTGGSMTYTPNADYIGSDAFTFMVFDGSDNSNISTINITVATPRLFLRATGNDATAAINDAALPFLTAQAAADAIVAFAPSIARPLIVDVGAGNFGNMVVSQTFGYYVTWIGVSAATSIIGNISANGADGDPGVAVGDPSLGDWDGDDGTNGSNINIESDYNIQFGSISSNGGNGGAHAPDPTDYESVPGSPGNGGRLTLTGKFGTLSSRGGNGNAGGAGGDIALNGSSTSLSIDASGGQDICTIATSCPTLVSSGEGGYVRVYAGSTVTGNITSNGGENNGVTAAGTKVTGKGGSVYVGGTLTGNITNRGGNTYDAQVGNGGNVGVDILGSVGGTINSSTGDSANEGEGASGGVVIIRGAAQDIYTASFGAGGGRGGSVQIFGTANNIFTNNTTTDPFEGVDGGAVNIESTGVVNSVTTNGGYGTDSNGTPGPINIYGTVSGTARANGADSSGPHAPGTGGVITITDSAIVNNVHALGGNYIGAPGPCINGGSGGLISVETSASYNPVNLLVTGGSGSACGSAGANGSVTNPF